MPVFNDVSVMTLMPLAMGGGFEDTVAEVDGYSAMGSVNGDTSCTLVDG